MLSATNTATPDDAGDIAPVPLSVREYRELESGARSPNFETWDRICRTFGRPQSFVDGRKSTSAVATTSEGRWTGS